MFGLAYLIKCNFYVELDVALKEIMIGHSPEFNASFLKNLIY